MSEDTWNEPLGRGTEIRLHLRDEAKEYLEEDKLKVGVYIDFSISSACSLLELFYLSNYIFLTLCIHCLMNLVSRCPDYHSIGLLSTCNL